MKKITLMAALLGSTYFSHAQVGIGTPSPATSAMLDITSTTKGVLIPRVSLTDKEAFSPVTGTEVTSLLVYNTNTANEGVATKEVTPGFYYWNVNKWERLISQTDLTTAIDNANSELEDIISLLQTAYPSNNLDGSTTTGSALGGGMVYTPADGSTPAKIEYVYYNGTTYVKQDLTDMLADIIDPANGSVFYNNIGDAANPEFVFQYWDSSLNNGEGGFTTITISDLVQANETKTKIVTINNKQYYVSESYTGTEDPVTGTETGVFLIDVVGGVINNIEEIFTTTTNIVINEGETNEQTFTTVQEYIEYISQNADLKDGVMTFVPGTGATLAEQLASSSFTYNVTDAQGNTTTQVVNFGSLVKANQSLTNIATTNPSANVINYVYTAEPNLDGTARIFTIDLTQDLINQITNNGDVKNAITNVLNGNGGVFYNGTGGNLVVGNATIPAGSLYTMDADGNGVLIDLGSIVVSEVIENFNTIVNSPVTVNNIQYDSVEEYIQYIAETSDANVGFTTTEITAANNPGGTLIPANSFYYINDAGVKVIIDLEDLVLANESKTGFVTGTNTDGNTFIYYIGEEYLAQNDFPSEAIANGWANGTTLPDTVTLLDIPQAVSTNFETILDQSTTILIPGSTNEYYTVEEYIQYISETSGANVGYTTVEILEANNPGGVLIPANSIYYINSNGVKVAIPLGDIVYQGITQLTETQVTDVKTKLGDKIVLNSSIITGDTYKTKAVRKGIFTTTITENAATTSGVTLDVAAGEVISITVKYGGGLVANVTDLQVSGTSLTFNIGTGKMYQVLGTAPITAEVIVEFAVE